MKYTKFFLLILSVLLVFSSCQISSVNNEDNYEKILNEKVNLDNIDEEKIIDNKLVVGYDDETSLKELADKLDARILKGDNYDQLKKLNAAVLSIDSDINSIYNELRKLKVELDGIRYIEPSYKVELDRGEISPKNQTINPGEISTFAESTPDATQNALWGHKAVNVDYAWNNGITGKGVTVAVIDTRINHNHEALKDKMVNLSYLGDGVFGYDPVSGTLLNEKTNIITYPEDEAHGSHVAGTVAGETIGIAPDAKIMSIPIFQPGFIGDEYVAMGIVWAVNNGADILQNSWGGYGYSNLLKDAFDYALRDNVIVVVSAGNSHTLMDIGYPDSYPGIISVAAAKIGNIVTSFSNFKDANYITAPGQSIYSSVPNDSKGNLSNNSYEFYNGTSMASPHVTGMIALLLEKNPNATPYQIKQILKNSSTDITGWDGTGRPFEEETWTWEGWDPASGYGMMDVEAALTDTTTYPNKTDLEVSVKDTDGNNIGAAYVTLYNKGTGRNYFSKSTPNDALFYQIEPGTYDIIVGGPDYLDMNALNWRVEEQVTNTIENFNVNEGYSNSVSIILDTKNMKLEGTLNATTTNDSTLLFVPYGSYNESVLKLEIPLASSATINFNTNDIPDLSNLIPSGQYWIIHQIDNIEENDITFSGTMTINEWEIPVTSLIESGKYKGFIEDNRFIPVAEAGTVPWTIF
jgi:subtilisin family serine protease